MDQTIKLDTRKRVSEVQIAPLRRGERNNALLTVRICANGQPYDLTGKTASLVATTAAGKLVGPCPMEVAEAGTARIMLPAALYSAVGVFSGYVEIREGEALVDTTDRFGGKVLECADLDAEQAAEFTPVLRDMEQAVADAKRATIEANEAASHQPRIGELDTWEVWDITTVSVGAHSAQGTRGVTICYLPATGSGDRLAAISSSAVFGTINSLAVTNVGSTSLQGQVVSTPDSVGIPLIEESDASPSFDYISSFAMSNAMFKAGCKVLIYGVWA